MIEIGAAVFQETSTNSKKLVHILFLNLVSTIQDGLKHRENIMLGRLFFVDSKATKNRLKRVFLYNNCIQLCVREIVIMLVHKFSNRWNTCLSFLNTIIPYL